MFDNINLQYILVNLPIIILSLTLHEIAHGFAAYRLGDVTAKKDGRLSLNPLRHIDPIGLIVLLTLHFGWAKPVMINPNNLKNPKKDMAIISLAGPLTNFILSIVFFIPMYIFYINSANIPGYVEQLIQTGYIINVSLAIFNFLPIPPLDGSKILGSLLPDRVYYKTVMYDPRIGMGILLILSFTKVLSKIINPMIDSVGYFYIFIATLITGLIR